MDVWRNKKNNHKYAVINYKAINTTNAQDGQIMVIYAKGGKTFCREKEEFLSKFELVEVLE